MNCERENLRISYTSECFINFSFVYLGLSTRGDFRGKYIEYPMETSLSAKLLFKLQLFYDNSLVS